jgi:DNA-binding PadR family transcriptional regulator
MTTFRMTVAVATVLRAFLENPSQPRYGYDLMQVTGYPSGKLYPILARLQAAGWLVKESEDIDPSEAGRPPRRMYQLSPDGLQAARIELAALSARLQPPPAKIAGLLRPQEGTR